MKHRQGAYWVGSESEFTLYVDGKKRAEVDATFNSASIYKHQGLFRKPLEETFVVNLSHDILSEVEKKLAFSKLPILDQNGAVLTGAREQIEKRSAHYSKDLESATPVRDATQFLDKAHQALNKAAVDRGLNNKGAHARDLCAKAHNLLSASENQQFPKQARETIGAAAQALKEAVGENPVRKHIKLSEAKFWCERAAQLADKYGVAGKQAKIGVASSQKEARSDTAHDQKRLPRHQSADKADDRGYGRR